MSRYEGETARIKCEITGYPLPRYQWYKDGEHIGGGAAPGGGSGDSGGGGRLSVRTTPWGSR